MAEVFFARSRQQVRRIIASCMIGNALEWYDFVLCGYTAVLFARLMFPPSHSPLTALLQTYGVFFSGFVMRPLGALLFGYIGDHYGRRQALTLSIYCMAIPTTLMGLLPTYAQIGSWAGVFLAVLRLFQGLSMGGEFTGSMIFVVEQAPPGRQGRWGSFVSLSVALGLLVGSGLYAAIGRWTTPVQMESWGWRLPFLLSSVGSFVCFYMRRHLAQEDSLVQPLQNREPGTQTVHTGSTLAQSCRGAETTVDSPVQTTAGFVGAEHTGGKGPLGCDALDAFCGGESVVGAGSQGVAKKEADQTVGRPVQVQLEVQEPKPGGLGFVQRLLGEYLGPLVRVFFVDAIVAVGFFMVCVYVVGYLQSTGGFSYGQAAWTNTLAMISFALVTPLGGWLCDRWGPVVVMSGAAWGLGLLALPCFWGFSSGHWGFATFCHSLLGAVLGLLFAPVPAFLVSMFPKKVRYSGVSLAHNLSMALFGGGCPHLATLALKKTGWVLIPGVLVVIAAAVSLRALFFLGKRASLPGCGLGRDQDLGGDEGSGPSAGAFAIHQGPSHGDH